MAAGLFLSVINPIVNAGSSTRLHVTSRLVELTQGAPRLVTCVSTCPCTRSPGQPFMSGLDDQFPFLRCFVMGLVGRIAKVLFPAEVVSTSARSGPSSDAADDATSASLSDGELHSVGVTRASSQLAS
jgi:hypothetical protein